MIRSGEIRTNQNSSFGLVHLHLTSKLNLGHHASLFHRFTVLPSCDKRYTRCNIKSVKRIWWCSLIVASEVHPSLWLSEPCTSYNTAQSSTQCQVGKLLVGKFLIWKEISKFQIQKIYTKLCLVGEKFGLACRKLTYFSKPETSKRHI